MVQSALELFSGSGVMSARFRLGGWETEEVDIRKGQDVMYYTPTRKFDFVWASVPCTPYSALRYGYDHIWSADRTLWLRALEIIQQVQPRYWMIENVKMAQWVWGRAPYHYGPFFIWGYYPAIQAKVAWTTSFKGTHFDRATGTRWNEKRTAAERAVLPAKLCDAVFQAVNSGFDYTTKEVVQSLDQWTE